MSENPADKAGSDQADNGNISDGPRKKHLVLTYDFYDGKAVPVFKIPQELIEILLLFFIFGCILACKGSVFKEIGKMVGQKNRLNLSQVLNL